MPNRKKPARLDASAQITPNVVRDLLSKTLKSSKTPKRDAITNLAQYLESLRHYVSLFHNGVLWSKQEERAVEAILAITQLLPPIGRKYLMVARSYIRWKKEDAGQFMDWDAAEREASANLAAVEALLNAANAMIERGLPYRELQLGISAKRWNDFAPQIGRAFERHITGQSKEAAFRFIAAVIPLISGERPTSGAVRTSFMKTRPGAKAI